MNNFHQSGAKSAFCDDLDARPARVKNEGHSTQPSLVLAMSSI